MGRWGAPPRRDFQGPRLSHLKGSPPSPSTGEGEAGRARTPWQQAPEGGPMQRVPPPVPMASWPSLSGSDASATLQTGASCHSALSGCTDVRVLLMCLFGGPPLAMVLFSVVSVTCGQLWSRST